MRVCQTLSGQLPGVPCEARAKGFGQHHRSTKIFKRLAGVLTSAKCPEGRAARDKPGCQASKTAFRSHCARPTGRVCERGVLSEFRAARTCASYWFDNKPGNVWHMGAALFLLETSVVIRSEGDGRLYCKPTAKLLADTRSLHSLQVQSPNQVALACTYTRCARLLRSLSYIVSCRALSGAFWFCLRTSAKGRAAREARQRLALVTKAT